jgi:tetratricopeptide (TPR) repeat protein
MSFAIGVAVLLILTAFFGRKLKTADIAVIAVFSYLSLTVVRHSVLFAIALTPVAGILLSEFASYLKSKNPVLPEKLRKYSTYPLIGAYLLITAVFCFLFVIPGHNRVNYTKLNLERQLFPLAGVEFVKNNPLPGRLYNPYEWGGYIIWKLYPEYQVFIDGRANTIYTEEQYRESLSTMRGDPGWDKILDKYNINFVFCNKALRESNMHFLPDRLAESGGWVLIFEDDLEMIFIRKTQENSEIIKSAEQGKLKMPVTPFRLNLQAGNYLAKEDFAKAEELLQGALSIDSDYIPALAGIGYIRVRTGQTADAERIFNDILQIDPSYPSINFNLGKMYEMKGDKQRAAGFYQKELKINPGFEPAKRSLEKL